MARHPLLLRPGPATGPVCLELAAHGEAGDSGGHGVGRRQCRPKSDEPVARPGRGGGARGAPECDGPDSRCGEVRGSLETLVHIDTIGAEGHAGEGPLRGLWRPASGSWRISSLV
jgi:hypothetical protein